VSNSFCYVIMSLYILKSSCWRAWNQVRKQCGQVKITLLWRTLLRGWSRTYKSGQRLYPCLLCAFSFCLMSRCGQSPLGPCVWGSLHFYHWRPGLLLQWVSKPVPKEKFSKCKIRLVWDLLHEENAVSLIRKGFYSCPVTNPGVMIYCT